MKKEVIVFKKTIQPLEEVRFEERIKDNGVIESLRVRFYTGVENSLQVIPYVDHKINRREDLLSYNEGGDKFISGNDDYFIYPLYIPVEYDDDLNVYVKNINATYPYTLSVDVIISYDGEAY